MNNEEKNFTPENEGVKEIENVAPVEKKTENKKLPLGALIAIIVGAVLVLTVVILAILLLGGNKEPEVTYANYTVTVVDGLNNPVSNVMVTFMDEAGNKKMRVTEKDGIASYNNALAGEYTVTIQAGPGNDNTAVIQSTYILTKDVTSAVVVVRDTSKTVDIYGEVPEKAFAYYVNVGDREIVCNAEKSSYVVFHAPQSGIYKILFASDDSGMTVGHYGNPMIAQPTHCGDLNYDGKSFELIIKDQTTPYLIGLYATKDTVATLKIERIGDAPFDPFYDAEWITVESTATLTKCDLGGKTLTDIDIASADLTVSLGDDGYYYTSDGKPVYIRITSQTGYGRVEDHVFIPALGGSLALLAGHVDQNVGVNIGGYVYDENGNFQNKYRYNDMIKTYMDYVDPDYGVVPLTEELAECIKLHGEANGWFNPASGGYLFDGIDVNVSNAWLFLCMVEK